MFELPDAKRVRREDLFDTESTRHSSPEEDEKAEIQAKLRAKLSNILTVDFDQDQQQPEDETDPNGPQEETKPAEPEFEFRLFSTGPTQKVVLAPAENEKPGEYDENSGGIVEPRPLSYYIRGELSPEQREQFASAAIDASEILKGARQRAWGLELPWRVVKITVSSSDKKGDDKPAVVVGSGKTKGGKKKLNKRGRIASRIKHKAALELEKAKMTKEEHLKEKKKRLNREKKLKRRQKEREKKLAAGGGGEAQAGGGDQSPIYINKHRQGSASDDDGAGSSSDSDSL
ncbi:Fungal protein of unknown function (DUF2011) domain containing protein [Rhypophila sp. PSN 637]